jgi:hypothetical protein
MRINMEKGSAYQRRIFNLFQSRTIAYNPDLARALGSVVAALFLGQLLFWYGKGKKPGWIYKTEKETHAETGLSRKQQETAIRICKKAGFLETKRAGVPPKRHFKIDMDKLTDWLLNSPKSDALIRLEQREEIARSGRIITESTQEENIQRMDLLKKQKNELGKKWSMPRSWH